MNPQAARDNSYQGTFGASGWGHKAQETLGQVSMAPRHLAQAGAWRREGVILACAAQLSSYSLCRLLAV